MAHIKVDRARLFYEVIGTGKPIVLIHGLGLNRTIWKPMVKLYAKERQFISFDVRGQGQSTLGARLADMDQFADDLAALLDELKIEKAIIAGHSMGGYIGQAFAAKYPDRLAGLALVTSNARADSEEKRIARLHDAWNVLTEEDVYFFAQGMAPKLTRDETIATNLLGLIAKTDADGLANVLFAIANRKNRLKVLANLTVPCMAIFGLKDQIAPPGVDTEMEQACPNVKVIRLPGIGHMPMLEEPLTLGALLLTL